MKEMLYDFVVRRNKNVQYEYERYVMEHMAEHRKNRMEHWKILFRLYRHYVIRKKQEPVLYQKNFHSAKSQAGMQKKSQPQRRKFVYRQGAESLVSNRKNAEALAKQLLVYDYISFDVFDTLIFRPFARPTDLFMIVGEKLKIVGFVKIRIEAEQQARKENELYNGNREVTLEEIYIKIQERTNIPVEKGIAAELETEWELCYANPYMKRVYDLLTEHQKHIIATSDMYLSGKQIDAMLKKCGYKVEAVIVSCEHNASKSVGSLYDYLKLNYNSDSIVHIGDNYCADIKRADESGITSVYYKNVNEVGNPYRAEGMSALIGSAYWGIVNAHLHNGVKKYSVYYEFGYIYAGFYILGYCNFIKRYVEENQIEKVLFLARDGEIYQRVFHMLYPEIETEYVLWSRVPAVKTAVSENRDRFFVHFIESKINQPTKSKIGKILEVSGLASLCRYLDAYGLEEEEFLTNENVKILERMLTEQWEEVEECYQEERNLYLLYMKRVCGNAERLAVVDVGWMGNVVLTVKENILKALQKPCFVGCLLAGINAGDPREVEALELTGEIVPYIFSHSYNRNLYDTHRVTPGYKPLNSFLFEMMSQSNSPTFLGFMNGQMNFDIPEVENYEKNKEIHLGIMDFAAEYMRIFKNYPYMHNISGYDAYLPFRMMIKDISYFRNNFSDYAFVRTTLETADDVAIETMDLHLKYNKK